MTMSFPYLELLLMLLSFVVSLAVYPLVLRFAKRHNIVDNPNSRKLQRVPVPVMGGFTVFFGILVSLIVGNLNIHEDNLWVSLLGMTIMLSIGAWDDMRDVPATLRFILEIVLVYAIIVLSDISIDSLHGLWGVEKLPANVSLPLSIIAGVGTINSINLIDGVDGYSSGYGIMSCVFFAILFYYVGDLAQGRLAIICIGALVPFFLHNVFGSTSKMFIGDSGTLMMGTVMAIFVFSALSHDGPCSVLEHEGFGLAPFILAVLSIPVFDTLRVMGARIVRGLSPFHPDKTHLHHLFIEMGFSHIWTSLIILMLDFVTVTVWFVCWKAGASIDVQFYVVLALGLLTTFVFYRFMKVQQMKGPLGEDGFPEGSVLWKRMCWLGESSHIERTGFWRILRRLMDGK